MRKSKQEAAETRERIVETAATEFRENGIVATGLSELMESAGLTHGGFYRHFESKAQLIKEANAAALTSLLEGLTNSAGKKTGPNALRAIAAKYLSVKHRDSPGEGCPLAALGSELARADTATREVATDGFLRLVEILTGHLEQTDPLAAKQSAMIAVATMVGALTISRIVTDDSLSRSLLRYAEEALNSQ